MTSSSSSARAFCLPEQFGIPVSGRWLAGWKRQQIREGGGALMASAEVVVQLEGVGGWGGI